jgi:hypothetical protein
LAHQAGERLANSVLEDGTAAPWLSARLAIEPLPRSSLNLGPPSCQLLEVDGAGGEQRLYLSPDTEQRLHTTLHAIAQRPFRGLLPFEWVRLTLA